MKIAIPTNGDNLESEISKSFGRAKRLLLVDLETLEFEIIDNVQNLQATQGAGIQSAQSAIKSGGDILITMHCGPKAYRVLSESGAKVYIGVAGNIRQNINEFKEGTLGIMTAGNVEGHWV